MKDQDEMFEAATELPAFMGCPQHLPKALPGGFDGTGPVDRTAAVSAADRTAPAAEDGGGTAADRTAPAAEDISTGEATAKRPLGSCGGTEALQKRGAKLFACNERMRERIVEIAHLANECLLNTNHPNGYEPGQYGQDYRTYGKAIGQIRRTCKESMVEFYKPEEKVRVGSSSSRKDGSTPLSHSHSDLELPTGWLCELAKKLEASSTVPSALSPTGADKAAKTAEYMRRKYSFCDGLFPISHANCEKAVTEHCWINGRRFTMELTQDIHDDGEHVCCAKIRDNGNLIAKLVVYRGKSISQHIAHGAFRAYVRNLSGSGKFRTRGGFLKLAAERARAAKQQAYDNKGAAAN